MKATPPNRSLIGPMLLGAFILLSAIAVVQIKHRTRVQNDQSNKLLNQNRDLSEQWAQLQLEEHTYSNHGRIEAKARNDLHMVEPLSPIGVAEGPAP